MSLASISDNACTHARVQIPSWGVWWADVTLVGEVELSGSVTLKLADAEFVGTIKRGGSANGKSSYRIAGGAGAWDTVVSARAYHNDLGVKRATIVADAATDAGETVDTSGLSGTVGAHYTRPQDTASRALDHASPKAWRVDSDGVTRFGARAALALQTDAPRVRVEPASGIVTLGTQEIAALLPGVTVDDVTAVDVLHELTPDHGLRTTLYGSPWGASRRSEALRRVVYALFPQLRWNGVYEYRIGLVQNDRLALQPVLTSLGLPILEQVKVRPGMAGLKCTPTLGSLCLVSFVNSDPSRPVVVSFDDAESSGFGTDKLEIDSDKVEIGGAPLRGVARLGDTVGPYVITSASSTVEVK